MAKWEASSWAKKKARKAKRARMTDFDRFKVGIYLTTVRCGKGYPRLGEGPERERG